MSSEQHSFKQQPQRRLAGGAQAGPLLAAWPILVDHNLTFDPTTVNSRMGTTQRVLHYINKQPTLVPSPSGRLAHPLPTSPAIGF